MMKKLLFVLLLAVVMNENAFAQKGMMGVGGNIAMNVGFDDGGIGIGGTVKFQYYISNYFRIEPSFTYYAPMDKENGTFDLAPMVNIHAFILPPGSVRPYAFLGVGYLAYKKEKNRLDYYDEISDEWTYYTDKRNYDGFGVDGGLGLDCRLTHSLSLQVEAGILLGTRDDDAIGAKASVGLCYNF